MGSVNVLFIVCYNEWITLINLIAWCLAPLSVIFQLPWQPVLEVAEAGVSGENNQALSLAAASRVHPFGNLQSRARTHAVLVIVLYELLGNPTT